MPGPWRSGRCRVAHLVEDVNHRFGTTGLTERSFGGQTRRLELHRCGGHSWRMVENCACEALGENEDELHVVGISVGEVNDTGAVIFRGMKQLCRPVVHESLCSLGNGPQKQQAACLGGHGGRIHVMRWVMRYERRVHDVAVESESALLERGDNCSP